MILNISLPAFSRIPLDTSVIYFLVLENYQFGAKKKKIFFKRHKKKSQLLKAFLTHQFCNVFHIISDAVRADPCSFDEGIK